MKDNESSDFCPPESSIKNFCVCPKLKVIQNPFNISDLSNGIKSQVATVYKLVKIFFKLVLIISYDLSIDVILFSSKSLIDFKRFYLSK